MKRGLIILVFALFFLNFHLLNAAEVYKAINEGGRVFVAVGEKLYAIEINEGKTLWEYDNGVVINNMEMLDWNSDGEEDMVISGNGGVTPPIKIINGKTGEILHSIYPKEKSYLGNSLMPVSNLKVIDSKIIFSSDSLLYKIEHDQPDRMALFETAIEEIEVEPGLIKIFTTSFYRQDSERQLKYIVDLNGKIISREEIEYRYGGDNFEGNIYNKRELLKTNCPEENFESIEIENLVISGIRAEPRNIYCTDDFIYYLNDSKFLLKRDFNSQEDIPVRHIECPVLRVLGEIALCYESGFDVGHGRKISLSNDNFITYYNGGKELAVKNTFPFNYRYGDMMGNFNFEILNQSLIRDISSGWDYDGDNNQEILLYFDGSLMFFETSTGQKHLITLRLNEQQFAEKNNSLNDELKITEKDLERATRRLDDLQDDFANVNQSDTGEINKLNRDIEEATDERNELQEKIYGLNRELANLREDLRIKGFDFCDGKLFVNSDEGVYLFEDGNEKKRLDFSGNPNYLACLDDLKLGIFSYLELHIIKYDGLVLEHEELKDNGTLRLYGDRPVQIRKGEKIYLPVFTGEFVEKIYTYDSNGELIDEFNIENVRTMAKNGKLFLCSDSYDYFKLNLLDEDVLDFHFNIARFEKYRDLCEEAIIDDCDDDGKNEIQFLFKRNDKLERICLNDEDNMELNPSDYVSGRNVGDYSVIKTFSENRRVRGFFFGSSEIEKPSFPYEVYDGEGKKVLVSSKPVFCNQVNSWILRAWKSNNSVWRL